MAGPSAPSRALAQWMRHWWAVESYNRRLIPSMWVPAVSSTSSSLRLARPPQTARVIEVPLYFVHMVECVNGWSSRARWTCQRPISKSKSWDPSRGAWAVAAAAAKSRGSNLMEGNILGVSRMIGAAWDGLVPTPSDRRKSFKGWEKSRRREWGQCVDTKGASEARNLLWSYPLNSPNEATVEGRADAADPGTLLGDRSGVAALFDGRARAWEREWGLLSGVVPAAA